MKKNTGFRSYLALAVALVVFVIYLAALQNDFVLWDDGDYIAKNPHIRTFDLGLFKWAFFDFYAANWHPLTWISHALDYAIWGLNPLGHHLTNIVLHTANSFIVVFLMIKLLDILKQTAAKKTRLSEFLTERTILITAGTTGLLFGLHPLHVESVAWAAERKDLLCAVFFLLSIIMYVNYVTWLDDRPDQNRPLSPFFNKQYLVTIFFFALALLSKPMAVTLPVVLLILDWYPFQRIHSLSTLGRALVEKIPFFALSLGSSILTIQAQSAGTTVASLEMIPLSVRIFVAAKALIAYLWKMVWPMALSPFYQYYFKFEPLESFLTIAFVIGLTIASIVVAKKQKVWAAAWGCYVITLMPVIGIVQVGSQSMADRYTYLPSLGPFFIIGLVAAWVCQKVDTLKKPQPLIIIRLFTAAGALLVLVSLSYLTFKQIAVWNNTITLWSRVIENDPAVLIAYMERGKAFDAKGQPEKAVKDYNMAISLSAPGHGSYADHVIYCYRGAALQKMGQIDKARNDFDKAIALNPSYSEAYNCRGVLFRRAGLFGKAIEDLNHSIALDPRYAKAYNNRGIVNFSIGQYGKALEDFNRAILLEQDYAKAYFNRGLLYSKTGQKKLAQADFKKACDLGDDDGCKARH